MNYSDRRKQVIWTSPSGKKFNLMTDGNIKISRKRKGEVKNNPTRSYGKKNGRTSYKTVNMSDDTFQDMGVSGRDFSFKIYFLGDNHDIEASNFEAAYCEHGQGKLQLPYGNIVIVQALDIDYEQNTVEKSSLTEVNISFHECGRTTYPTAKTSKMSAAKKNISETKETLSQTFSDNVEALADKETFASKWSANIDKLADKLSEIQNAEIIGILEDIQAQNILNNPLVMSTQLGILFKKAYLTYNDVSYTISSAADLLDAFLPSTSNNNTSALKAEYTADDIFAKQTIISACEVLTEAEFETRKEAINVADNIQEINDEYIEKSQAVEEILNKNIENIVINNIDTNKIVNDAIGSITSKIEDLKIEKTIYLKECSNSIMIAYKFYPDLFKTDSDAAIDYVNKTNNFQGDDLLYLEKGRRILIYV